MSKTGKKITLAEGLKEAVGVVKNKKKLNEGPGAGYTVESSCTIEKVNSLSLNKIDLIKENVQYGIVYVDATFDCDIDLYVDDLNYRSYYYVGSIDRGTEGKATKISLSMTFEADSTSGGGWSHVTYDGTIAELSNVYSVDYTGAYHNDYDTEIIGADAKITEQKVIDYVDKDVDGDTQEVFYEVYDEDGESLKTFDNQDDAIEFAKDNNGQYVEEIVTMEDFEGEVNIIDSSTVWKYEEEDDEVDESLKLKEDNILVSPEFIKKRDALADYFGEEGEVRYDKDMDLFILPDGRAYFVYTGDEADQKAKEEVINSIDDMGIEAFTPDFRQDIIDNQMVDVDWFDDAMKESYEVYADDIMSEDGEHGNRLFDEMIEEGVMSEEDVTEDGELVDGIDLDEKKEEFVEKLCERWNDGVEWYIDNFGEGEFSDVCKEHDLYDYDEIAETAVRWDGRGHFISYYDGDELDIGDDLFAYKYEKGWDWDKADSIHESMNEKMGFVKKYKGYSIHDTGDDFTVTDKHGTTVGTERTISGCEGLIDELTKKETVTEDTVKLKDGKWANVGKDGKVDSGKFRTKKEADAQRRAMFANKG